MATEQQRSGPIRPEPVTKGDDAPHFTLPAITPEGEQIEVAVPDVLSDGPVLLVFYQDDGMPICTSELKAFAQEHELLAEAGVQVFGINTNGLGSHRKFQEHDSFPFPLISDFHGEAVKSYGMWDADEQKSRRAVVVIGEDGRVAHTLPHFNPGNLNAFEEVFRALGLL
jgi:peroxiredoxin Q/BCP